MKVLWFTNIELPEFSRAEGRGEPVVGGWMQGLLDALRNYSSGLEIGVAFRSSKSRQMTIDGVCHYALDGFRGRPFTNSVKACLEDFKPDVIHLHGSESISQRLPDCVFDQYPTLLSIQGIISGCHQHYCGGLSDKTLDGYRSFLRRIMHARTVGQTADYWRNVVSEKERLLFSKVRHVAGRTEWDMAWSKMLSPKVKYHHVGEILRKEFYDAKRDELQIENHRIYSSACMTYPLKGGHWLLEAIAILKNKYPDISVRIPMGSVIQPEDWRSKLCQNEYHRYLMHLIKKLNIGENIVLLPKLGPQDVKKELNRAAVFVMPSMIENSPNSLAEAQMVGVPTVVTNVGGVSSMVNDEDGLLIPSADPVMLATSIDRLFESANLTRRYSERAYEKAIARHNPNAVIRQLVAAYEEVSSKR